MKEFNAVIDKDKLQKFINSKRYSELEKYITQEQNKIESLTCDRLNPYIQSEYIYEDEINIFKDIAKNNIILEQLKDKKKILINNMLLDEILEKRKRLEKMKEIRNK